jgi:ribonuclease VapC
MVVDSSALIAILREEADCATLTAKIAQAERCLISAVTLLETSIVAASRRGLVSWARLDALMKESGIEVIPLDEAQQGVARDAFLRFGRGRHPAALNICDCAAYALAKQRGLPLLFKGNDFAKTDVIAA